MRIICYSHSAKKDKYSGCWWIRLKTPLEQMARKHVIALTDGDTEYPLDAFQIVVLNNVVAEVEAIRGDKVNKKTTVPEMVEDIKRRGIKIIYDLDDLQNIHPLMGAVGKFVDDNLPAYFYLLKEADLITCTTEKLKKSLQEFTDKPIVVLPNCINPLEYPKRKHHNKIKIGYVGSYSHIPDFDITKEAISNLKRKHDIYFEILGFKYHPFKSRNAVPMEEYHKTVAEMGNDIGICPLLDNKFNHNKSPLKALEYAAMGTVFLASNRLPYKGELKREWLCDDNEWEEKLERLIIDEDYREKVRKEQYEWVMLERNIKLNWKWWEDQYRKVLK